MREFVTSFNEKVISNSEIGKQLIENLPKISILGNREFTIENHRGISNFSDKEVVIASKIGDVHIEGIGFEICYISKGTIVVKGLISNLSIGVKDE